MSKELVISANRHETKVALIEDDQLVEVYFQRSNEYSLAGSIHKGRVTRVLPGMQSAFVDLGLERDTFLYVSDFLEEHEDFDRVGDEKPARERRSFQGREPREGRDQRDQLRDRDRAQREPQPRPEAATSAPAEAVAEEVATSGTESAVEGSASPETITAAAGETPQAAGAAPAGDRDRGNRDRRGRRSRRRRGGRGFPESKYAGDGEAEGDEAVEGGAEAGAATEPHAASEPEVEELPPLILPGESLAKYSRPAATEPVRHQPRHFHDRRADGKKDEKKPEAKIEEKVEEKPAHLQGPPPLPVMEAIADIDAVEESEFDEPLHYPPDNALPEAPAHEVPASIEAVEPVTALEVESPEPEVAQPVAEPDLPEIDDATEEIEEEDADEIDVTQSIEDAADQAQAAAEALLSEENGVPSSADDDDDSDIQAMILSDVEGIELESPEGAADEAAAPAEGATAQVRDRGGRYPHRGSRRMRRRGRGGDRGDRGGDRPEGRPEGARPEVRTEAGVEVRPEVAAREVREGQAREGQGPREGRADRGGERGGERGREERSISRPNTNQPSISDLLKEGQEIIVQIAKEPLGQKGARITSHIALPGRYVVYMPTLEHMGVSRKIASDEERHRLKRILQAKRPGPVGGFITRTAAEGRTEDEIAGDMEFLYKLWTDIRTKAEKRPAPMLLHHDLDIVQRILRDQLADNFKAIWIDNEEMYESIIAFVQRFQPSLIGKVKLYTREAPIFDAFSITNELEKALRPKVWLKSGGFIVINQTEALVAIDVNTGKYVGKTNRLEDTIVKTNTEAIKEIVRQIRLRDLGGIIVIDFIDMDERKNRQKVMQTLEEAMRVDRAPYKILQFNDFGLVAITRKRVKQSLERTLCMPCPHCEGAGYIKSTQTVVSEILIEARKIAKSVEGKDVMLRVHPDVAKVLKSSQNKFLEELEEVLRRPVLVKSDPQLHHEKFDLA
jgi:ribonuclease G